MNPNAELAASTHFFFQFILLTKQPINQPINQSINQ